MVAPIILLPLERAKTAGALQLGDILIAVDDRTIDPAQIDAVVSAVPEGTPLRYRVLRGKRTIEATIPTTRFTMNDFVEACLPFVLGGVLGLLLGIVPVLARPDLLAPRVFCVINLGLAIDIAFRGVDAYMIHDYPRTGWLATGVWVGAYLHLALAHPIRRAPLTSHPRATLVAVYGFTIVASALNRLAGMPIALMLALTLPQLIWLANLVLTAARASEPPLRLQARVLVVAAVPPMLSWLMLGARAQGLVTLSVPLGAHLAALWFFGALVAYAAVQHNLFELDAVVRRAFTLVLLALTALAVYAGLFGLLSPWLDAATAWAASGVMAVLLLVLLPVVAPFRRRLEEAVEQLLFPRQREARDAIHAASRDLVRVRGETELATFLRETVVRTMASASVRVLVGGRGQPLVEVGASGDTARLELPLDDALAAAVRRRTTTNVEELTGRGHRGRARGVIARATALGVSVVVPLPGSGVEGAILVGPRADGRLYTQDDVMLLETLAGPVAIALENARAWEAVRGLERRLQAENLYLRQEVELVHEANGIVGHSAALRAVLAQVDQVAPTDATVLVVGETGTGKELVVRALHARSRRAERALVKVACAALPEPLLESELFGYEKGAFTGAAGRKPGRFEVADAGTLFLDDVDTLPLGVQAKLLRALQEGEIQRLGSNEVRRVDVRVVAATNRDLLAEVRAGRFREDLYYRLNVIPVRLPPLRERREDIPELVEAFVQQDGPRLGRRMRAVSAEAMAALKAYHWPGNVRELRNVVQRAVVLNQDDVLRLPGRLEPAADENGLGSETSGAALGDQVRELKIRLIREALEASGGNQRVAAERLGLHRQSLTRMIRDLGLQAGAGASGRGSW